jgi:DNA-binding XRE family transcriptional regulator
MIGLNNRAWSDPTMSVMRKQTKQSFDTSVELHFRGPIANSTKAVAVLKLLGFVGASYSGPRIRTSSKCYEREHSGKRLAEVRSQRGLTQVRLSELTGILQCNISRMENGKRGISREMAMRLGKALDVGYRTFL